MKSEEASEIDPELEAILRPERAIPRETSVDRAALWRRLSVPTPPLETSAEPKAAIAGAKAAALKVGLAAFTAGLSAGVFLDRAVLLPSPPVLSPPVAAPQRTAELPGPAPTTAPVVSEEPALPRRAPAVSAAAVNTAPRSTLEEERELIDVASAALSGQDLEAAQSALSRHRSRFPAGALTEEREGLSVLVAASEHGWTPEAEVALGAFARRYPESPLLLRLRAQRERAMKKTGLAPTDSSTKAQ